AYATSYLRAHYPAEFACSLLNAQPMGFYSPATIIDDARRHGVVMRPIDITKSAWNCTLEPLEEQGAYAVRLGLRYVKGLGEIHRECIEEALKTSAFTSLADVVRRSALDSRALSMLAEAGAFECFVPSRRRALWEVRGQLREREASMQVVSSMRAA